MRAWHRRVKNTHTHKRGECCIYKKEEILFTIFSEEKKRKGKNVKQIVIRGRKIRNLYDTNANKSCAAKLHFIRIFYWRLFLIYIKLTIGGARKRKPRSKKRKMANRKAYFTRDKPENIQICRLYQIFSV